MGFARKKGARGTASERIMKKKKGGKIWNEKKGKKKRGGDPYAKRSGEGGGEGGGVGGGGEKEIPAREKRKEELSGSRIISFEDSLSKEGIALEEGGKNLEREKGEGERRKICETPIKKGMLSCVAKVPAWRERGREGQEKKLLVKKNTSSREGKEPFCVRWRKCLQNYTRGGARAHSTRKSP